MSRSGNRVLPPVGQDAGAETEIAVEIAAHRILVQRALNRSSSLCEHLTAPSSLDLWPTCRTRTGWLLLGNKWRARP